MKLLEKLDIRWNKAGTYRSRWGLFLCDYCNQKVEKTLSVGFKIKSCGCARDEIISKKTNHSRPDSKKVVSKLAKYEKPLL